MSEQPPSQPYPGHPYPGPAQAPTNGKAVASLITGVSSLVLSICCLGVAGIVAIVLGVKARKEISASGGTQNGDGLALGGIITGALGLLVSVALVVLLVALLATGNVAYNDLDPGADV